jgi:catechol 2,3-dioxygenase-like lactoylglutathione lyase family enzyme
VVDDIINAAFHHIALNVNKYDQIVKFYEAIGFKKQIEWVENGLMVCFLDTRNGMCLELHEAPGEFTNSRVSHICVYVDDVEAFHQVALYNGAEAIIDPGDSPPLKLLNGKEIFAHTSWVRSPNGEVIEVLKWKDYDRGNYQFFDGSPR